MRFTSISLALAGTLAALPPAALFAGCRYLAESDTIQVSDYTLDVPCTPGILLRMDRMNDWGKVAYDSTADTYRVSADLQIGNNDGTATFFQLGSAEHPNETLLVRGNVVIHPCFVKGDDAPRCAATPPVNRLTLGSPTNPAIRAALKIDSEPGRERTLFCGAAPRIAQWGAQGGELHVYNGLITAASPDPGHSFGAMDPVQRSGPHVVLRGSVVLDHAVVAWFKGVALWSADSRQVRATDTVFEHGDYAACNSNTPWDLRRCIFRDLGVALADWGGAFRGTLTDCVFTNNAVNWKLATPDAHLICVDCDFDDSPARKRYGAFADDGGGKLKPPTFTSQRHVIVEAVDAAGSPLAGAAVRIACEQNVWEDTVFNGKAVTGPSGRTPGPGAADAVLMTEYQETATAAADAPRRTDFSYSVTVSTPGGKTASVKGFRPRSSWEVLRVPPAEH